MSTPEVVALIPAAGASVRMRLGIPKPLVRIADKTILERTVSKFLDSQRISVVIVTAPNERRDQFADLLCSAFPNAAKRLVVIPGGTTRQESVHKGVNQALRLVKDPAAALIAVHDCARCLITDDVINRAIDAAIEYGAVTTAIPVVDTVKRVNREGVILETLDRSVLWQVQTPQIFKLRLLEEAHRESVQTVTDDAALVESLCAVRVVLGERRNFKITTPEDLRLAEALLRP